MSARLSFSLAAFALMAACSTAPTLEDIPAILPEPDEATVKDPDLSWTEFATCRQITLETEEIDFTAPEDAASKWRRTDIIAEFALSPSEQQRGLQQRYPLHPSTAMLFEFPGDHNPVLWMKDTPASLDMVFFDAAGDAFYLEAGTEPNSRRFLTPEEAEPIATHVLELPAGKAFELGVFPGTARMILGSTQACRPGAPQLLA